MSPEENTALIIRAIDLFNARRLDEAVELYDLDYVNHGPGGQELRGRDGIRGLWDLFLGAFPDLTIAIEDVICQGSKVALRWTVTGSHRGEFLGIPATNKSVTLRGVEIFQVDNGTLREAWDQYDRLHLIEQIGSGP